MMYLFRTINSKKRRNYNTKKLNGKNSKSVSSRPFRNRRLVSVSTSFGATPNDFDEAIKKMSNQRTQRERKEHKSQLIGERLEEEEEDDDEEEKIDTTVPIKEVESDEDNNADSDSDDGENVGLSRNLSDLPIDKTLSDLV